MWAQLEIADDINNNRLASWQKYYDALQPLAYQKKIQLPYIPSECVHNAHMFYIKLNSLDERTDFIKYMKESGVMCVFHYVPLHSAPAGMKFGRFHGKDVFTTAESDKLVRLPLYYNLKNEDQEYIIMKIKEYFL